MLAQEIGIDLGSANTVVVVKHKGIVASEPSVVAIDRMTREVIAVGTEAATMIGRTPDNVIPIRPVQSGVISDLNHSSALLKHMIRKSSRSLWLRPQVLLTVQTNASKVDQRALAEAAVQAGAGEVRLVEQTIAAALGAGLPIDQAIGSFLVDIGCGTTEAAILSLGGVVVSGVADAAGAMMDEAIFRYLKREHNLLVGAPTAERVKVQLGSALPGMKGAISLTGRLLTTGLPASISVEAGDVHAALAETLIQIDELVIRLLEKTPPELIADISKTGLTLTGGGALLHGIDQRLHKLTGLPVMVAEQPLDAVALGIRRVLEERPHINLQRLK